MNNESTLAVCWVSVYLSHCSRSIRLLQRTTLPPRMWRATHRTRPTPTPSVTTWPTWEPSPGTRRSTAMRSAWRRAMVRVISCAVSNTITPLACSWLEPLSKDADKNRTSSNWTTALENWPITPSPFMSLPWMNRLDFFFFFFLNTHCFWSDAVLFQHASQSRSHS